MILVIVAGVALSPLTGPAALSGAWPGDLRWHAGAGGLGAVGGADLVWAGQAARAGGPQVDRPGFRGGRDLWEGWGSWYQGRHCPLSCGNAR
jgi:hypothetical protein